MRLFFCLFLLWPMGLFAQEVRIATWGHRFGGEGPGLLLRDILRAAPEVEAAIKVIQEVAPDLLLLTQFDYDADARALAALAERTGFAFYHAFPSEAGKASGADRDGDGRWGEAEDAVSYGRFEGAGALALLANFPFEAEALSRSGHGIWRITTPKGRPLVIVSAQMPRQIWEVEANRAELAAALIAYQETPSFLIGRLHVDAEDGRGDRALMAQILAAAARASGAPTQVWPQTGLALELDYLLPPAGSLPRREGSVLGPLEGSRRAALIWQDWGDFP